ncbi:hypothetical protein HDV05_000707 [Chytridiales sp. JEL 0842]|nr:hypothetical protein HDV05_000707 [Chytridiales sp. JEL 0842]
MKRSSLPDMKEDTSSSHSLPRPRSALANINISLPSTVATSLSDSMQTSFAPSTPTSPLLSSLQQLPKGQGINLRCYQKEHLHRRRFTHCQFHIDSFSTVLNALLTCLILSQPSCTFSQLDNERRRTSIKMFTPKSVSEAKERLSQGLTLDNGKGADRWRVWVTPDIKERLKISKALFCPRGTSLPVFVELLLGLVGRRRGTNGTTRAAVDGGRRLEVEEGLLEEVEGGEGSADVLRKLAAGNEAATSFGGANAVPLDGMEMVDDLEDEFEADDEGTFSSSAISTPAFTNSNLSTPSGTHFITDLVISDLHFFKTQVVQSPAMLRVTQTPILSMMSPSMISAPYVSSPATFASSPQPHHFASPHAGQVIDFFNRQQNQLHQQASRLYQQHHHHTSQPSTPTLSPFQFTTTTHLVTPQIPTDPAIYFPNQIIPQLQNDASPTTATATDPTDLLDALEAEMSENLNKILGKGLGGRADESEASFMNALSEFSF